MWADQTFTVTAGTKTTLYAFDLLAAYRTAGGSTQGVTVVRTILDFGWLINEAHVMQDYATMGLVVATKTVADAPDPVTEPYADWAYITTLISGSQGTSGTAADTPDVRFFDVHSSRKIDEIGDTWMCCLELSGTGTLTWDAQARARTLLLLP